MQIHARVLNIFFTVIMISCLLSVHTGQAARIHARGVYSKQGYDSISRLPSGYVFEKGVEYTLKSIPDSALICFSILANQTEDNFKLVESGNLPNLRIASLLNLGYLYQNYYYDYAKSYSYYHRALKAAEEAGDHANIAYAYIDMAEIHEHLESNSGVMDSPAMLLKRACRHALLSKDSFLIGMLAVNLISLEIEKNDTEICRPQIDSLLNFRSPPEYDGRRTIEAFYKVHDALQRHSLPEAIAHINQTLDISRQGSSNFTKTLRMFIMQNKVALFQHLEMEDSIISTSHELLEFARENDSHQYISRAYRNLYKAYDALNDDDNARTYEFLYLRHADSLRNASNLMMARDLTFTHQIEDINTKVRILTAERRTHLVIIIAISIVTIVILSALIYFIRIRAHLRHTNRLLYDRVQELLAESGPGEPISPVLTDVTESSGESDEDPDDGQSTDSPAQESRLSSERSEEIYRKVQHAIMTSPDVYSPDFSIRMLASQIGEPYYAISMAINDRGVNFKSMVTDQRIKEACRRLKDPATLERITMETFSAQLGFKSRTYFTSVFKKLIGLTPTQYSRLAKENAAKSLSENIEK